MGSYACVLVSFQNICSLHEILGVFEESFYKFLTKLSLSLYLLACAVCSKSHILCLIIVFIICTLMEKHALIWFFFLSIFLSNDVESNPGPSYYDKFFTFMNWNINSLAKYNFQRVQLIEALNTIFNYDLISIF